MGERFTTRALLLRATPYGERDSIVTLLTEQVGKVSAVVRGARSGSKRIGGAIEPLHTVSVSLEEGRGELLSLKDASLLCIREIAASKLETIEAGGVALRWARHIFPPRTAEPRGWEAIELFLDALNGECVAPAVPLVRVGFRLLEAVGYALDFEACVGCRRDCPDGRSAYVSVRRGGVVCQSCGGGERVLEPTTMRVARALARDEETEIPELIAVALRSVIDDAMTAHADYANP